MVEQHRKNVRDDDWWIRLWHNIQQRSDFTDIYRPGTLCWFLTFGSDWYQCLGYSIVGLFQIIWIIRDYYFRDIRLFSVELDLIESLIKAFLYSQLQYEVITYLLFVTFMIIMSIIIMNLLVSNTWSYDIEPQCRTFSKRGLFLAQVGLAVDDIKEVQDNAVLESLAMQVITHPWPLLTATRAFLLFFFSRALLQCFRLWAISALVFTGAHVKLASQAPWVFLNGVIQPSFCLFAQNYF